MPQRANQFCFMSEYNNASELLRSGITITYHDEGSKARNAIVMLHGLNAHSGTWRNNIPHFATKWRAVAPSLPPTRKPLHLIPVEEYTDYVDELLEKINVNKVSLIGNSMGGWIGMILASRGHLNIHSLILEDTATPDDPESITELVRKINETDMPILIIWGANDRTLPLQAARSLHSDLRNSQLEIFDDAGHVPHWEIPDKFNSLVERFLEHRTF